MTAIRNQWFFETMEDFAPEPGFETQFNMRAEDKDYPHLWKVTEVVPGKKLLDSRLSGCSGACSHCSCWFMPWCC